MTRTFVELPFFQKKWKALGLDDKDLKRLQEELIADPKVGAVMQGTGGIRKMRFAFEKRGKSGSIRIKEPLINSAVCVSAANYPSFCTKISRHTSVCLQNFSTSDE